ncbi:MAG TPA: phage holin family protein, partial [Candidatus Binatia bacterium]|nr:phage holin family protein [Candidatus Binatia bacterium]
FGGTARSHSLWNPLTTALATLSSAVHTRLQLFATELEEEIERLKQMMLLALILFFCGTFGIILLTVFTVAIFWQAGWVYALGALALIYLGAGLTAALLLRKKNLSRPRLFSTTLSELAKDRDRLRFWSRD